MIRSASNGKEKLLPTETLTFLIFHSDLESTRSQGQRDPKIILFSVPSIVLREAGLARRCLGGHR